MDETSTPSPEQVEAARLAAENCALKAQMAAIHAARREELMAKHADRIAPAAREQIAAYGAHLGENVAAFEAFLVALPQIARPERVSAAPAVQPEAPAKKPGGVASMGGGPEGAAQVAQWLGTTEAKMDAAVGVSGVYADGTVVLRGGGTISAADYNKRIA